MSSSRRDSLRPIQVVEVKPRQRQSSLSPLTPSSPKAVRFAPSSVNAISRPLSTTEAWSIYHFENHAKHCPDCYNPLEVTQRGGQLCETGHGLAQDVACHVYHREGDFYSTSKDYQTSKLVRVEIPRGYDQLRSLLKSMDRALRSHRTSPIISYDRTYPVSARRFDAQGERESVIIEPANSSQSQQKRSKHKSARYSTVVLSDDMDDLAVKAPSHHRRGSLYDKDMQRKKENYRVEIREPRRRDHEHERRGAVWL